jgi:hypothetical protein
MADELNQPTAAPAAAMAAAPPTPDATPGPAVSLESPTPEESAAQAPPLSVESPAPAAPAAESAVAAPIAATPEAPPPQVAQDAPVTVAPATPLPEPAASSDASAATQAGPEPQTAQQSIEPPGPASDATATPARPSATEAPATEPATEVAGPPPSALNPPPSATVPLDLDPFVLDLQRQLAEARVDQADLKNLESRAIAAEAKAGVLDGIMTELRLENAQLKTDRDAAKGQVEQVQAALAASDAEVSRLQTQVKSTLLAMKAADPVAVAAAALGRLSDPQGKTRDRLEIVLRRAVPVGGTPREPGF